MSDIEWSKRDKPYTYLKQALEIFNSYNGKIIVEIGTNRSQLNHDIDDSSHDCCMEGHSSIILAPECEEFYSVDINADATSLTREIFNRLNLKNNYDIITGDGIKFLKDFNKKIDMLFLDAWDVDHSNTGEKHLEAYNTAFNKLSDKHIILIDDTDVGFDNGRFFIDQQGMSGKGVMLIPHLLKNNYKLIFTGRQTCLVKE